MLGSVPGARGGTESARYYSTAHQAATICSFLLTILAGVSCQTPTEESFVRKYL